MRLPSNTIINTREDLDAMIGSAEHAQFIEFLRGSITRKQNVAVYPEGYGQPGYTGQEVEPVWQDVEDLSTIQRFGFSKADLLAE